MIRPSTTAAFVALAVALAVAAPVAASAAPTSSAAPTPQPRAISSASVGERGAWGLFIGIAVLGLAPRRRGAGPVVTD